MKRSRRELSINIPVIIDWFNCIFKNNQIALFTRFTFIPKTGVGIHKTEIIFHGKKWFCYGNKIRDNYSNFCCCNQKFCCSSQTFC